MMHSEIPCLLSLDHIQRGQASGTVSATPAQRAALAERLRLPSVSACEFEYAFARTVWPDVYRLSGHLRATLVQECVLTLEPIASTITESFSCLCGPSAALAVLGDSAGTDTDEDPPEEITAEGIDVGELAIQYLSLALNDYPRGGDVSLPDVLSKIGHTQQDNRSSDRQQPFQRLENLLRQNRKGQS
jgi:hypothetical protein